MNAPDAIPQPDILHAGDLEIDTRARSVSRDGSVLDLPDLSYRLLVSLVLHAPHRVSKDQLIEEVWQGVVVSDETLSQRIRLLRRVLGEDRQQPRYIVSVRNQGYRLIAAVSEPPAGKTGLHTRSLKFSMLMSALVVVIGAALLYANRYLSPKDSGQASVYTLAVLPFTDLSQNGDNRYFSDGIHEELLSRLAQIENLAVVSRTSVLPYRFTELGVPEIARQLKVGNILEGSVRLMGNRVRITTQLIDGESDHHLWSETFERELSMKNLFAIQAEVANSIALALEIEFSGSDRSRIASLPTDNLDAYNYYLLGRYHTFLLTEEDLSQAVQFLTQSIELDDDFAEAWAALGWAYSFQGSGYGSQSPHEVYDKAREAALRALALDADLADAHSLYADILTWYDWDWPAAEREYKATLALNPFNLLGYALFLSTQLRHEEAIMLVERLINRFPGNEFYHSNAAWRFFNARDYQRALEQADLAGGHIDARRVAGWALLSIGRNDEALALFERDVDENPVNPADLSNLAVANIRVGNAEKGQELLASLLSMAKTRFVAPEAIAAVYFEQNKPTEGFEWLRIGVDTRSSGLIFLQVDHVYDGYRSDPRYLELLTLLGFGE